MLGKERALFSPTNPNGSVPIQFTTTKKKKTQKFTPGLHVRTAGPHKDPPAPATPGETYTHPPDIPPLNRH